MSRFLPTFSTFHLTSDVWERKVIGTHGASHSEASLTQRRSDRRTGTRLRSILPASALFPTQIYRSPRRSRRSQFRDFF